MVLLNRSRLSVQPVTKEQYEFILERAREQTVG
jgi:predicted RNA-binding protein with PUA-like domain